MQHQHNRQFFQRHLLPGHYLLVRFAARHPIHLIFADEILQGLFHRRCFLVFKWNGFYVGICARKFKPFRLLTSMFSCNVKNGCIISVEWSPSRCSRDRNSPRNISLSGVRPKSADRVTLPLFLFPISCTGQTINVNQSSTGKYPQRNFLTCHSSPSSPVSPLTSPLGTIGGGSLVAGFSTNFFSFGETKKKKKCFFVSYDLIAVHMQKIHSYLQHFIVQFVQNETQKLFGILLSALVFRP